MQTNPAQSLAILQELDAECRQIIVGENNVSNIKNNLWSGIGFKIKDNDLIIHNESIEEILGIDAQNKISDMPGAKPWLIGLISLRGHPIPVIDLKRYLFNESSTLGAKSRLIVIKEQQHTSAILLEEVHGLKQFSNRKKTTFKKKTFSNEINPFIDKSFSDNGSVFGNFSIPRLTNSQEFINAAR